jgi:hypothetical protein
MFLLAKIVSIFLVLISVKHFQSRQPGANPTTSEFTATTPAL